MASGAKRATNSSIFPNEEDLRGKSRTGKMVLPEPTFKQPKNGAHTDNGQRLTPDFNPSTVYDQPLKFEKDLGLGEW